MEDNKLKSFAKKISGKFKPNEGSQYRFYKFSEIINSQIDFFKQFKLSDLIKIFLYIESVIKTGDTLSAEKVIKDSYLVGVFRYSKGDFEEVDCDNCGGDGQLECSYCGGSNEISCSNCEGDGSLPCNICDGGEVTCPDCKGDGCENCDESGQIVCPDCGGSEEVECPECSGSGTEACPDCVDGYDSCHTCDGSGSVQTDREQYYYDLILVPNARIGDELSMKMELREPVPDDFNLSKFLRITSDYDFEEFSEEVIPDKNYVYGVERLVDSEEPFSLQNGRIKTIFQL